MDRDVDARLKQLYDRIHRGYSVTLNDLVFLSRHDVDCYVRTYQHLVLDDATTKVEEVPMAVKNSVPYTRYLASLQQHIDMLIGELRTREMKSDLVVGLDGAQVFSLIGEPARSEQPKTSGYQYFSAYETPDRLNLRA